MKKKMFLFGYAGMLSVSISLQSCSDDPITPNGGGAGNGTDTTWVNDSTDNGGNPYDSTENNGGNDNPGDTIIWNGGGDTPGDSTDWNPYDSTYIGG